MATRIMTGAACAAALVFAMPVSAVAQSASTGAASQGVTAALGTTVAGFYRSRNEAPIWFRDGTGAAARELTQILARSKIDGFDNGPELAAAVESARLHAASGDPRALAEAERLLSAAWVAYVQAINWPAPGVIYGHPAVAPKVPLATDVLKAAADAPSLAEHLRAVSRVNPIYAQLRDAAWHEVRSGSEMGQALAANLHRAKALPGSGRYVLVDLASARLWMMEDGRAVDSMKVIVGKPSQQTPLIVSQISHATFNPYWNVPVDLAQKNIAPRVLRDGFSYLRSSGYEVLSDWTENAQVISPDQVDWKAVADGRQQVRVRQRPGAGNMMGELKFAFSNNRGIYLHDTPERALFAEDQRTFSSGCVRLEDARRLARWLLGREPVAPSKDPELQVALPSPVPVYLTYLTIQPDGGALTRVRDVYGLDAAGGRQMAAR